MTDTYRREERFSHKTCSCVQLQRVSSQPAGHVVEETYKQLHFGDFLVDFLHELDDKVDQLVLEHLLSVEVCDEEGDVIALDGFPAQNVEGLGSLCQEARELVDQNVLNLVCLLNFDADAHAVDAWLNVDALIFISRHGEGVEDDFGRARGLNFGDVVALRGLGGKVGQREGSSERRAHALEVGTE